MNKLFNAILVCGSLFAIASCSSDDDAIQIQESQLATKAIVDELEYDESMNLVDLPTRASISIAQTGITFAWDKGDAVGIFPIGEGTTYSDGTSAQAKYVIRDGEENNKYALFNGGAFGLIDDKLYASYYPYNEANQRKDQIAFDYAYLVNEADKITAGGYDFINKYNYMMADQTAPVDGYTIFHYQYVGSMVLFSLQVPKADSYDKVTITCSKPEKPFVTYATGDMNVLNDRAGTTNNLASNTPTDGNTSQTINFTLKSRFTVSSSDFNAGKNNRIKLFFWMYPQDYSDCQFDVYLHNTIWNDTYHGVTSGKSLKAGTAYAFEIGNMTYKGKGWVYDYKTEKNPESSILMNDYWLYDDEM